MNRRSANSRTQFGLLAAALCVLFLHSNTASAKKAVVPPLVARSTSAEAVLSMTTLVSSELEFMDAFEEVVQLPKRPSQLGSNCLKSSSCLKGIARNSGAQGLVGGSVSKVGSQYNVSIVYMDGSRIVRTVKGTMSTDPAEVADELAALVREAVTGVNPTAKAEEDKVPEFGGGMAFIDDEEEEDDDSYLAGGAVSRRIQTPVRAADDDYGELDEYREEDQGYGGYGGYSGGADAAQLAAQQRLAAAEASRRAQEDAQRRAAEEAQRRAAAEAQRRAAAEAQRRAAAEAQRRRAQLEAKRRAAEEAARRAAEEARRAAAEAARYQSVEEDNFDPNAISFGGDANDIEYEDIAFGSASSLIEVEGEDEYAYEEEPQYNPPPRSRDYYYDDLDEPAPRQKNARDRRSRDKSKARPSSRARGPANASNAGDIGVIGRVGFARFQFLSFLTYGAEASYQVQDVLALVLGMEAFSTRRELPPELVPAGQPAVQWNTVLPVNLGLLYKPSSRDLRPYVGAGAQLIPGYVQTEQGAASAFGFRVRGGADYLLTENFGVNLNVAAGLWAGTEFYRVEEGLQNTAMVPQISVGTLLLF